MLRTSELSRLIKVPVGTLRQWRHRGFGPLGFRVGGTVVYRRSEVDRWLAEQERAERERAPYCAGRASA
ncbi:helix-turn-helix transcriptional regulator [Frankia gtarii]|nr:helix-turn-helix domain-containing protein [Frankia gtarii]